MPSITAKITLDKAGRVVLPKPLRDSMHLVAGDTLQLDAEGDRITLRLIHPHATLRKEHGIWVYQGEPSEASIPDLIDRERDQRVRELAG
jgi:AbrB family looped-hinge helix DNA binding protein